MERSSVRPQPGRRRPIVRKRQRGEVRRPQIADAALRIIGTRGLREFTVQALAREIGVSDAALFRHFPSKLAIVLGAIDRMEEILFEGFPPEAADPLARLGRFFELRVDSVTAHPGVARLLFSEDLALAGGAEGADRVAVFKRRSLDFVRVCLEEARRRRRLTADIGTREATLLVVGALLALLHAGARVADPAAVRRQARRVWRLLERVLSDSGGPARGCRKVVS